MLFLISPSILVSCTMPCKGMKCGPVGMFTASPQSGPYTTDHHYTSCLHIVHIDPSELQQPNRINPSISRCGPHHTFNRTLANLHLTFVKPPSFM